MTKDELIEGLSSFCAANPPLEYKLYDTGERLELTILDEEVKLVSDACYITYEILACAEMDKLLEARLKESKRAYEELLTEVE